MAAAGTPLRTLQGWMGHRDYKTTEIYADFALDPTQGAVWAQRAFGEAAIDAMAEADPRPPRTASAGSTNPRMRKPPLARRLSCASTGRSAICSNTIAAAPTNAPMR